MPTREGHKRPALDLVLQDERITCELHRSRRGARNMTVRVRPDGSVRIGAPRWVGLSEIRAFVETHAYWIASERRAVARLMPRYVTGAPHRFLGESVSLVVTHEVGRGSVQLVGNELRVVSPRVDEGAVRDRLRRWYRMRAEGVFAERGAIVCSKIAWLDGKPDWRQRRMRAQWGNCSQSGEITLNTSLVKAAVPLIDYVIVHEVCHLKRHDHGAAFQRLMDDLMPDWRARRRELNADPAILVD